MEINIPSQKIVVEDLEIKSMIADIDKRLKKLEEGFQIPSPPVEFNLYSKESFWNKPILSAPIDVNSKALVNELFENLKIAGGSINTTKYSRTVYFVDESTPKQPVYQVKEPQGEVAKELLAGVRIPQGFKASMGGDGHATIIDKSNNKEYDFWQMKLVDGRWVCTNAGILNDVPNSNGVLKRLSVWNSATATHLPLAGGLITKKEIESGIIKHCIAIAINRPKAHPAVKQPALTTDGWYTGQNAIMEGQRFRFPSTITINQAWCPFIKMLVAAIRDYGMIVMDKTGAGVSFYVQDPTQFGLDSSFMNQYKNNKADYQILGDKNNLSPEFPWLSLEALA